MKRITVLSACLLTMVIGKAQEVKIDFITPSIVHVVKGQPTKSLVVIAQPEDVKVTSRGNDVSSSVLTIRKDPKTGDLTFLTVKGKVLLKEKSCDIRANINVWNSRIWRTSKTSCRASRAGESIGRTIRLHSSMMTSVVCRLHQRQAKVSTIILCMADRQTVSSLRCAS